MPFKKIFAFLTFLLSSSYTIIQATPIFHTPFTYCQHLSTLYRQLLMAAMYQYGATTQSSSHAPPFNHAPNHTPSLTASISPLCRQLLMAAMYQYGTTTQSSSQATTVLLSHWEKGVPWSRTELRRALLERGREGGREEERDREREGERERN